MAAGLGQNIEQLQTKFREIDQKIDTVQMSEGPKGDKGDPGVTLHNSFGDPNTNGVAGYRNDYPLDAATGDVYKKYGNPLAWNRFANLKGPRGEVGSEGEQGRGWKNSHDLPADPPTRGGDFLLHNTSGDIYKSIGWPPRWEKFRSLKGPGGEKGEQGRRDEVGPKGEKGNTGSPGQMNVHIHCMLYRHIGDIVKMASFYTLTTPYLDYANINYSQQNKVVRGNYASETYNDSPYTSNMPQIGNWNLYAAYEFDAIEADSDNMLFLQDFIMTIDISLTNTINFQGYIKMINSMYTLFLDESLSHYL